jgi:hypothetical protein
MKFQRRQFLRLATGVAALPAASHRTSASLSNAAGAEFLPGKSLARPETGAAFSATTAYSARQRLASPASLPPKPREVKDYSGGTAKPDSIGPVAVAFSLLPGKRTANFAKSDGSERW